MDIPHAASPTGLHAAMCVGCLAVSTCLAEAACPKLRNEAYQADRLDEQLADQTRYIHRHDRWFRYDPTSGSVHLTKLYEWYGGDFKQVAGSVLDFAARYSDDLKHTLQAGRKPQVKWLEYDWKLSDKANAQ